jgi:hypothetical protein
VFWNAHEAESYLKGQLSSDWIVNVNDDRISLELDVEKSGRLEIESMVRDDQAGYSSDHLRNIAEVCSNALKLFH